MSVCVRAWVDNRVAEGNAEWVSHVHHTNYRVGVTSLEPCSWHCKIEAQLLGGWSISEAAALRWNMFAGGVQESASNLQMIKYCCSTTACWLVSSYSLIFFGLWTQFSTSGTLDQRQIHWSSILPDTQETVLREWQLEGAGSYWWMVNIRRHDVNG